MIDDLEGLVNTLRKAGAHFHNDIVTGIGGKQIILLLQGISAQEIQSTIKNEIRMIPGVLRIKQLSALNFSTK